MSVSDYATVELPTFVLVKDEHDKVLILELGREYLNLMDEIVTTAIPLANISRAVIQTDSHGLLHFSFDYLDGHRSLMSFYCCISYLEEQFGFEQILQNSLRSGNSNFSRTIVLDGLLHVLKL
jgi:hypothetical protein